MLMPKKNRTLIYEYLMKEGVVVAEKDFGLDKHPAIAVPNIHVIKALQVCLIDFSIHAFRFYFFSRLNHVIWSKNNSPGVIIIGT
jgi:hypothetical protein